MPAVELTHVRNLTSQTDIFVAGAQKCLDVVAVDQRALVFHAPAQGRIAHSGLLAGKHHYEQRVFGKECG